jgi:proteic killer suppression protein
MIASAVGMPRAIRLSEAARLWAVQQLSDPGSAPIDLLITLDVISRSSYHDPMIESFRDKETERLFSRKGSRRLPDAVQRIALRKLAILDAADSLKDLALPPGNRLEKLSGDRAGQHSIRVNDQWRVCFRWGNGDAHDVEIVDYH